jgi:Ca2+-binding RTX toxin-like protein
VPESGLVSGAAPVILGGDTEVELGGRRSMHLRKSTIGAVAALALIPGTALAATIEGGPGNDRLRGTHDADLINGHAGNDRIRGFAGNDTLLGESGNDRIFGGGGNDMIRGTAGNDWLNGGQGDDTVIGDNNATGDLTSFDKIFGGSGNDALKGGDSRDRMYGGPGNDTSEGENGNDRMAGGTGDDVQNGGEGNDTIYANLGNDTSYGGNGNDRLWALARGDVHPGPNGEVDQAGDALDGGPGNDVFRTRDGEVDRITCGDGFDLALLDTVDVITDATPDNLNGSCERVIRRAPKQKDSATEDATQAPKDANVTS